MLNNCLTACYQFPCAVGSGGGTDVKEPESAVPAGPNSLYYSLIVASSVELSKGNFEKMGGKGRKGLKVYAGPGEAFAEAASWGEDG